MAFVTKSAVREALPRFLTQFTQIVLQQQHAGLTATPRRALVRERNGWDPPGRPSMLEEQVGGRQREEEDL